MRGVRSSLDHVDRDNNAGDTGNFHSIWAVSSFSLLLTNSLQQIEEIAYDPVKIQVTTRAEPIAKHCWFPTRLRSMAELSP